jgi:hypothetical protein
MANGAPPGIPGANVFAVIMAAPTDILGLATRQLTETMGVFNLGVQRLGTEIAQPPAIPAGLPALPAGLPPFPFPGMAAAAPPAPAVTGYTPPGPQAQAQARRIPDRGLII